MLAAAVLAAGAAQAPREGRPPIDELIDALQAKYDSVRNFSAAFEQTYAGGVLRTTLVERGTVMIKKPGKMRWRYTSPEEKLFVSDGASLYSYLPIDRQVIVGAVPSGDSVSTPALLLAGRGDLSHDFSAAYDDAVDASPGAWAVELTPARNDVDYTRLTLVVDRESLSVTQVRATDFQGAVSTFTFSDLKENQEMPDDLFAFTIPPGVEVIADEEFRR